VTFALTQHRQCERSSANPHRVFQHPCIYVTNPELLGFGGRGDSLVTTYGDKATGNVAPLRLVRGWDPPLRRPVAFALDSAHNVYVTTDAVLRYSEDFSLCVFAPGSYGRTSPIRVISGGG
jgi:hypothetical protein